MHSCAHVARSALARCERRERGEEGKRGTSGRTEPRSLQLEHVCSLEHLTLRCRHCEGVRDGARGRVREGEDEVEKVSSARGGGSRDEERERTHALARDMLATPRTALRCRHGGGGCSGTRRRRAPLVVIVAREPVGVLLARVRRRRRRGGARRHGGRADGRGVLRAERGPSRGRVEGRRERKSGAVLLGRGTSPPRRRRSPRLGPALQTTKNEKYSTQGRVLLTRPRSTAPPLARSPARASSARSPSRARPLRSAPAPRRSSA